MVATRRRKSGEKSEDAKEKNGANGTKNGKASKGRSSGGLVAAAAVAVLAVAAGVALAPDTLKDQVRRSLGVSSAAPPRLAVKKEAPGADDVDPACGAPSWPRRCPPATARPWPRACPATRARARSRRRACPPWGSRWRALRGLSDSGYGAKPSS